MKRILVSCIVFAALMLFVSNYDISKEGNRSFVIPNIEALTMDESEGGIQFHCRCHNDDLCYGGNAISFRKLCFEEPPHHNGVATCSEYDTVCQ